MNGSSTGGGNGTAHGSGVDPRLIVTCSAPTNIAVIKYWGKDSKALNTAINSSASLTLCQDDLKAITTVAASRGFERDRLWLNGVEEDVAGNRRFQAVIRQVRALASDRRDKETGELVVAKADWDSYKVHIVSRNTFPTAAGLASSAAGLACLTFALAQLFCAKETFPGELTAIARQGSGSACRSMFGGFVKWVKGSRKDARDSIATQVAPEDHWPELRAVILVVSAEKKHTSSTAGMEASVLTSPLLGFRAREVVEPRLRAIEGAFLRRDFDSFGRITMQDSNQFHATCLDTYPPVFYMNDVSRAIVRAVHAYNDSFGDDKVRAAYTFDAGPNAVIYTTERYAPELLALLLKFFPLPATAGPSSVSGVEPVVAAARKLVPTAAQVAAVEATGRTIIAGQVQQVYCTKVGDGPRVLGLEDGMVDPATGLPDPTKSRTPKPAAAGAAAELAARAVAIDFRGLAFAAAFGLAWGIGVSLTKQRLSGRR